MVSNSKNPFLFGTAVPPEYFVGRIGEIETAFDQILNSSHLAIWGGPGFGKSSFLKLLASPQVWKMRGYDPSEVVIVLFSCLNIHPFSTTGFWQEVLSLIRNGVNDDPELQTEIGALLAAKNTTKDGVREVAKRLGRKNRRLFLLIDDYDAALANHSQYTDDDIVVFLNECRNLACHSPLYDSELKLSMVVTSLRRLNDLRPDLILDKDKKEDKRSPWFNHYMFQLLRPFEDREISELLNRMPLMTVAHRDGIREMAGGHPALLQIAGSLLYRELRTGQMPNVETLAKNFESTTLHFFQNIWDWSDEIEQVLLMLIALSRLKGRLNKKLYDPALSRCFFGFFRFRFT